MKTSTAIHSRMMARMMGSCSITVGADGQVSNPPGTITVSPGGDATAPVKIEEVNAQTGSVRDPALPPETDEEKATRLANETPEQKTAREAAEAEAAKETTEEGDAEKTPEEIAAAANEGWEKRDTTKDVAVTAEQEAQIQKMATSPEQQEFMRRATIQTNTINDLTPAMRAEAAKLWNVPPDMVERYVASVVATNKSVVEASAQYDDNSEDASKWSPKMQAEFKARMDAVEAVAGGADQWKAFGEWASNNLPDADVEALQEAIQASPIVGATVAKQYIAQWKAQGGGTGPVDLSRGAGTGGRSAKAVTKGFATRDEQNAAISDPRYSRDATYRAVVDSRIIATNFSQQNAEENFFRGAKAGTMMV